MFFGVFLTKQAMPSLFVNTGIFAWSLPTASNINTEAMGVNGD